MADRAKLEKRRKGEKGEREGERERERTRIGRSLRRRRRTPFIERQSSVGQPARWWTDGGQWRTVSSTHARRHTRKHSYVQYIQSVWRRVVTRNGGGGVEEEERRRPPPKGLGLEKQQENNEQ